jgi:hypothetical protein
MKPSCIAKLQDEKEIELLKFHAKSARWKENHKIKHTNLNQTSHSISVKRAAFLVTISHA